MKTPLLWCLLCALCLVPGAAFGHEFIVKPQGSTALKQGQNATGQVQAAHIFMVSEEAERIAESPLHIVGESPVAVTVEAPQGKPWLAYSFAAPTGGPFMLVGWRKPQVWSLTTQGIMEGDRETLKKQGKSVASVGKYEKFAKTLYNLAPNAPLFTTPVGQRLEIVPVGDVSQAKGNGQPIGFTVLLDGKRANLPLHATYDGFSKEQEEYAFTLTPDKENVSHVPFSRSGLWLLQTQTVLKENVQGADTHSLKATLVLQVP
ncbi:DUF4198 domain-containing protein [Desulfovibrio cuneatus]|uniref:DUF4198 domain-containing protein n=1 Tax=Desulfovibrio cuneatus TaxID=159728 RepID=UPI0003F556A2|nr:DUF4198 domain-containing protein [Desulfovibrio cuneatus]